ncbi:MAG TPA: cyclic pyranopterin monophosphate synthase MoaC [Longimicrobiales bacterium]|jgi:cyclic pyranopterin phosphate synthase
MTDDRSGSTHLDSDGAPHMVDVSGKSVTERLAVAEGRIRMDAATARALREGRGPKGDALQVARLAGIMAGKRTGDLIPLCHVLPDASVTVELHVDEDLPGVLARAEARVTGRTGVEMEALTAVGVALLTVYDMSKALDRGMVIEGIRLLRKEGGRSGTWAAEDAGESGDPASRRR